MTPLLVLLGAAALCSLAMSTEIVPQADFNVQAAEGKWYFIGFGTNYWKLINMKDKMKMGVVMLVPTAEGGMDLSYASLRADGSCWRISKQAKKTDTPGKFAFVYDRPGSKKDLIMVDVKYDEYALVYNIRTKQEVSETIKLYGRKDEVSAEVKEKFRQLALNAGFLAENIVFLPKNAECPPA